MSAYCKTCAHFRCEVMQGDGKPLEDRGECAARSDYKIVDADDQTIKDYILENGLIIAAADGTTSKEENVDALKKNGFIIAMDGTVSDQACDGRIPEGTSAEEAAEQILAIMNSK